MDQVHLPDPVKNDLERLQKENILLRHEIDQMKQRLEELGK
jgi:serine O-acetyltransferase